MRVLKDERKGHEKDEERGCPKRTGTRRSGRKIEVLHPSMPFHADWVEEI
jgi:hypothetical protein